MSTSTVSCASTVIRLGYVSVFLWLASFSCMQSTAGLTSNESKSPANPSDCLDREVKAELQRNDFKSAIVDLRDAIRRKDECAETQYMLAYSLLRDNNPEESLSYYTSAAKMRKPTSIDLRNVALDYTLLKDYREALRWIDSALAMDSADGETWYVLGRIQYTTKNATSAAQSFQKALELSPNSGKVADNLGLALEALNEPAKAVNAYREAIRLNQQSEKASEQPFLNLSILLSHQGNLQEALALSLTAVAISPDNVDVHEQLGHIYLNLGELSQARMHLESAVKWRPDEARLHFLLGQVYKRLGLNEKSMSELALSASLNSAHSTALP